MQTAPSVTDNSIRAQQPRLVPAVLLSAVLMTLAFPPADAGFLAWIALAPLLYALGRARRPRHAFALAYLFGFTYWGATILWIGTTVVNWSGTVFGWVAWLILVGVYAGWWGIFGGLAWWIARRAPNAFRNLGIAAVWVLMEWLRGQGSLAMPWSLAGYTQHRYLPLIQIADLCGVYGVTFVLLLVNGAVAEWWQRRPFRPEVDRREAPPSPVLQGRAPAGAIVVPAIPIVFTLIYGLIALHRSYDGPSVRVALMQPNVSSARGEPRDEMAELAKLSAMSAQVAPQKPLLVVWPESAAPDQAAESPEREAFAGMARSTGAYQLVGTTYKDARGQAYNSAALFAPDGALIDRYDKRWLVPYGEYVPGRSWLPFQKTFHLDAINTQAGAARKLLSAGPIRMDALICYESVFPILSREGAMDGANLLVSISNDSWAGESSETAQHFAMAVFRAVENRRTLVSSTTTGITGVIEPDGRRTTIPPFGEGDLVQDVRLLNGQTLYARWGDWFVALCAVTVVAALVRGRKRVNGLLTH